MARPKNSDLLKRQSTLLREAWRHRNTVERDKLWERMIDLYRGKHYASNSKEDRMVVNMAFATKNVIAPSVAINNPKFVVNARKPESADQAVIAEQVVNYLWRTHHFQDEFRLAVDDFLIVGHGWVKVGYKATKEPVEKKIPDAVEGTEDPTGVDYNDEESEANTESELRTFGADNRPFIERVSPFDVYVDPDAKHPRYMNWIAQRTRRPLVDVVVDKRYDEAARMAVNTALTSSRIDDSTRAIEGNPDDRTDSNYVDVWEFYDLRRNTVSTFCAEYEEAFLIKPKKIPYPFGHPFVMIRNYEVPDDFYPIGDLEAIEILQHELNATRTQQMNHRKRYQRKYLADKDAFSDEASVNALQSDNDNEIVMVDLGAAQEQDLSKVLMPMPQMGIPADFYSMSDIIAGDIDRVSGVSDYMRGAQAEIRRTATEAAMIQDAMNARAADKLARIETALSLIGARVLQLMQTFMTGEHVIRIVGTAQPMWMKFDPDFIAGEFDFEVEGGSTQPRNESFRRQSALQFVDAVSPFLEMGVADPMAVFRKVLVDGFDVKDPEIYMRQPMPMGDPMADPMQPQLPGMGVDAPPQEVMPEEAPTDSAIPGIPPGLVNQLIGQQGLSPV